jgi:Methyltransferase domain
MVAREGAAVEPGLGFSGTRDELLEIWNAAAMRWSRVPRRPTAGDVAVYRRLAGHKLGDRVLILGVTPELRDLVAERGTRPVVVDLSAAMHDATSRMLRRAHPASETWIEGDWCDAGLPADAFDLVLGDMVWWTMSVSDQHRLRDAIHRMLKSDGLFVGRFRFSDPARAAIDPIPVVAAYLERLDRGVEAREIEMELLYWLYDHTADLHGRRFDRERTRALLLELATIPQFSRHARFLRDATTRLIGADWTSQSRQELMDLVGIGFELVAEERSGDYDSSNHPILALRPR